MTPESPQTENQEDEAAAWESMVEKVGSWKDAPGQEMDGSIIEAIAALNLNGIETFSSCEGHPERYSFPYIQLAVPPAPLEDFIDQWKITEAIAARYAFDLDEYLQRKTAKSNDEVKLFRQINQEARELFRQNEKTPERLAWEEERRNIMDAAVKLLDAFYAEREVTPEAQLTTTTWSSQIMSRMGFDENILSMGLNDSWFDSLSESEKKKIQDQILASRGEVVAWGDFLKQRYLAS
jgi:hypothetical protein